LGPVFRYKIGLEIKKLESWDNDANHMLLVAVGENAVVPNGDKLKLNIEEAAAAKGGRVV
jgi:hypothetical protein